MRSDARIIAFLGFASVALISTVVPLKAETFFERYEGTKTQLRTHSCYPTGGCVNATVVMTVAKNGLAFPGQPTMREGVLYKVGVGSNAFRISGNSIVFSGVGGDGARTETRITLDGDRCSSKVTSNSDVAMTTTCTVVGRSKSRGKDNAESCDAVQKAIAEMKSLVAKNKKMRASGAPECDTWPNAYKLREIGTSLKGAACPSKFKQVDKILKSEPRNRCGQPDLPAVGIRG